jgi:hypothetical protein
MGYNSFMSEPTAIESIEFTGRNHSDIAKFLGSKGRFEDSYRLLITTADGHVLVGDGAIIDRLSDDSIAIRKPSFLNG